MPVAQRIERQFPELKVAGSNPARHTRFAKRRVGMLRILKAQVRRCRAAPRGPASRRGPEGEYCQTYYPAICKLADAHGLRQGYKEKVSYAPVAQLDRALACGAKGQRFKSSRAYHLSFYG